MRNSKLLSILTAGALAVSSFSGLAISGGVARANAGDFTAGAAAKALVAGSTTKSGLYFVDSTTAGTTPTTALFTLGAATEGVVVSKTADGAKAATAVLGAAAGDAVGAGNVGTYVVATATTKVDIGATWTAEATGVDYIGHAAAAGTSTVAHTVVYGAPFVVNNKPVAAGATIKATPGEKITVEVNKDLVTADATTMAKTTWTGTADDNEISFGTAKDKTAVAKGTTIVVSVGNDIGATVSETVTVDFGAAATYTPTLTVEVSPAAFDADSAVPYAVFTATDKSGNHYEDGASTLSVQMPRAIGPKESQEEYNKYVRDTVAKSLTITALWSADTKARDGISDTTKIIAYSDSKVDKGDGKGKIDGSILESGLTVNSSSTALTEATAVSGSAGETSYGLTFDAANAKITDNWTGNFVVKAQGVVNGKTSYAGTMIIPVKVTVADAVTATLTEGSTNVTIVRSTTKKATEDTKELTPNDIKTGGYAYNTITLDNGETGAASLKWTISNEKGTITADNLKYKWDWVMDNGLAGAQSDWIANPEANKIMELSGADTERVSFQPTTYKLGGTYVLRARVYTAADIIVAAAYTEVSLTAEAGDELYVSVSTAGLEKGYVEVPAATTKYGDKVVVKVTRSSGTDITKDGDTKYAVVKYETYVDAKNKNKIANLGSADGISMDKGVLEVKHAVAPGAYVVVVNDKKLGNYGADEENLIMVKSASGVAVTGLEIDQDTLTITNLNSTKVVVATVLPTVYQSNGYTKVAAKSAEVTAVSFSVADPSVVSVKNNLHHKYQLTNKDMDNTWEFEFEGLSVGSTTVTLTTLDGGFTRTIEVSVLGHEAEPTPEPEPTPAEHKAGDIFSADGYTVEVLADLTVAIQDAPVVGKTITIPEKVDGLTVSMIDEKAFKGSSAKKVYVEGAVAELGKAAFKKSKVKKVFFYQPAALTTVDKKVFDKTNAKVVAVGGSFSKDVAKQLEKAGAKSVKNNGTAK